jgi:quinol monooxygenase YgiN
MMIVIVDFTVAPADSALVHSTLLAEAPVVRALPGNLGFSIWADPDTPGTWRLMHEWTDAAGFEAYRSTPAFKDVGAILFPLMLGKPSSRVFAADMLP